MAYPLGESVSSFDNTGVSLGSPPKNQSTRGSIDSASDYGGSSSVKETYVTNAAQHLFISCLDDDSRMVLKMLEGLDGFEWEDTTWRSCVYMAMSMMAQLGHRSSLTVLEGYVADNCREQELIDNAFHY